MLLTQLFECADIKQGSVCPKSGGAIKAGSDAAVDVAGANTADRQINFQTFRSPKQVSVHPTGAQFHRLGRGNLHPKGETTFGQIFYFGTKYSEPMGATVSDGEGNQVPVHMGSHGIGVSRLLGAIIEASHDDKGIIWPEGVTPFHCGIVNLKSGDEAADAACDKIYAALRALGLDPLYDDTNDRAGAKFATMDLIGLPWRITVGPRGLKNGVVELTSRRTGESEELPPEEAVAKVAKIYGVAQG